LDAYRAVNRLAARLLAHDTDAVKRELAGISAKSDSKSQVVEVSA
jgi:hypothetical protein